MFSTTQQGCGLIQLVVVVFYSCVYLFLAPLVLGRDNESVLVQITDLGGRYEDTRLIS